MEINYELILKYLQPTNKIINNNVKIDDISNNIIIDNNNNNNNNKEFITQKNIFNYSKTFPDIFKNLLSDKFYRYGITIYDNNNYNVSFWTSLLTLIEKNFIIPYNHNEISIINELKCELIDGYKKSNLSNFLKQFDKNNIRERMKLEPDIYILQYICDILDITFIIFDFKNNTIYSVYSGLLLNPFKQIFIFAKYNSFWEPIMSIKSKGHTKRIFDINDINIKKILYSNIIYYYESDKINKEYNILLFKDIIDKEKCFINNTNSNDIILECNNDNDNDNDENSKDKDENSNKDNDENSNDIIIDKQPLLQHDIIIDNNVIINNDENKTKKNKVNNNNIIKNKKIDNIFIDSQSININEFNKSKLIKMKMDQIHNICNVLKIEYSKKTIKLDLINKILDKK
jgi:hypothetical protein